MNKVLELINKEKVIKNYRRKLINGDNTKKIIDFENLYAEIGREKCAWCKKEVSNPNIFHIIDENEEKKLTFCRWPSECHGNFLTKAIKEKKIDNKKCSYCKKNLSNSGRYTYKYGNHYTGEKKSFSFCDGDCWEKFSKKNKETDQIKDFSRVYLFAGNEFNQELEQLSNQELKNQFNFIDFNFHSSESPEFIEKKIKEIYNNPQNQKFIENNEFPIICFKNIEKIESNQNLEEALLPIFDQQQNSELFHGKVDLSNFIILTTTSTPQIGKLSDPLISRLNVVNVDTVQTKQSFLDKYYYWFLVPSILINLVLITLILWSKFVKKNKK